MKHATLALLVAFALGARVLFCLEVVGLHAPLRGDEVDYDRLAVSLDSGKGFVSDSGSPTASRPPLYPLLLAGIYRLAGQRPEAGRVAQIVLSTVIVLLVYALSKRFSSERVALSATALAALSPPLVFMSSYLLVENLYIALVLSFLILFSRGVERPASIAGCFIGGVVLGLSSLARPNALPVALFSAAAYALFGRERLAARSWKSIVILLGFFAAVAPWAARNEIRLHAPILFTTHGGLAFYQGNNRVVGDEPRYYGGVAPLEALPGWKDINKTPSEVARDRQAWHLGLSFIRSNPGLMPRMVARKFARFWRFKADVGLSGVKSGWWWDKGKFLGRLASSVDLFFVYSAVSIPLFVIGLGATYRRYRRFMFLYGIVVTHTVTALVFYGSLRSRIPVEPVIAFFAACGGAWVLLMIRGAVKPGEAVERDG